MNFEKLLIVKSETSATNLSWFPGIRGSLATGFLIRVQLILILALILDQRGVVFPVVRVLFFPERMSAAAVFFVAVGVIDLCMATFQETSPEFRKSIGQSYVQIPGV